MLTEESSVGPLWDVEDPRHLRCHLVQAGPVHGPAPTHPAPPPAAVDDLVARFLAGTLPREAWTHPAHLFVCHHLLQRATAAEVLDELRDRIQTHNARVGVALRRRGYHETITRYFVGAVDAAAPTTTAALLADPRCQRAAPQRHWSPEVLGSTEARRTWVPPDRAPLPWPTDP